jgi:hypothetical protein
MSIGDILEIGLFAIMAVSIIIIVLAVLKNVPKGKKGTSYRRSRSGE